MSFPGTIPRAAVGALVAGISFVATWWTTSNEEHPHHGTAAGSSPGAPSGDATMKVAAPTGSMADVRVTSPVDAIRVMYRASQDVEARTAIRASELSDWMRFRNDHPRLAWTTEMAVRWKINEPVSLRDVASNCSGISNPAAFPDLALSAEIAIQDRTATVSGWGCGPSEERAADRFCECILDHMPDEIRASIPSELADSELASYTGTLSLRLWRL